MISEIIFSTQGNKALLYFDARNPSKKSPCIKKRPKGALFYTINTDYRVTLATTPAPTVRPPSRIAKRRPGSIAIG